ncbi:glycosyltransferase [Algoriphagus sediminis]|uniref:Glycosyltransferase n=1 Tax=Algoriphagus sediminis TaxID=3057113 RepID=A0ABT7YE35_9BACT|nr:glycosyltransferase [Algoriphagus sediminis]MDN3204731.1 glycosyltransferase [Algoriphagus sediminis]
MKILFLGETYRADAQTWIKGIEKAGRIKIQTKEISPSKTRLGRIGNAFSFFFHLIFNSEKYDISLAERATSYGFFSLFVNSRLRVVAQQGITDAFPEEGLTGKFKRWLQRRVYKNVDVIHAWGHVMTHAMLDTGASPAKILVKPKGLDLGKFIYCPPSEKVKNSAIVTRSLYPIYRHSEILQAMELLKGKGMDLSCVIVGDGELSEKLKQEASDRSISELVDFKGRIPNPDLPKYLYSAQIYLAVPETEGVSASLFEAMATGCFPIVTDLPANRPFIENGFNGFLVPVGDVPKLAEAIERFLNDPAAYSKGIEYNRRFIEKECDLEKNMNQFYSKYQEVLANK